MKRLPVPISQALCKTRAANSVESIKLPRLQHWILQALQFPQKIQLQDTFHLVQRRRRTRAIQNAVIEERLSHRRRFSRSAAARSRGPGGEALPFPSLPRWRPQRSPVAWPVLALRHSGDTTKPICVSDGESERAVGPVVSAFGVSVGLPYIR